MSEKEQEQLVKIIGLETSLSATLLPIKTVGVQVNIHIYYYKQDQDKYVRERTRTAGED